jgi:hypothetical protein
VVAIESTFILIVSGLVTFAESAVLGVTVLFGVVVLVVSTAVESVVPDDMEDSLVPQLTTIIPKPIAAIKNFFIILYFGVFSKVQ